MCNSLYSAWVLRGVGSKVSLVGLHHTNLLLAPLAEQQDRAARR
jgi:hypothetical protein